jgi:Protein of unknown function DUF262/HNH endonuclease
MYCCFAVHRPLRRLQSWENSGKIQGKLWEMLTRQMPPKCWPGAPKKDQFWCGAPGSSTTKTGVNGSAAAAATAGVLIMSSRRMLLLLLHDVPRRTRPTRSCVIANPGATQWWRQSSKLVTPVGAGAGADNTNNKNARATFEEALVELESEALYNSIGTTQSTISNFVTMLNDGSLNLFPKYQRSYVWQPDKASRLIVTALCSRLVPPVVLHEVSKGVFDVVDGKQRLTSLLLFYLNSKDVHLPKQQPNMEKLQSLLPQLARLHKKLDESYASLQELSYDELSDARKRAYQSYKISYMAIPLNTPKADVFEVYEDINSGGAHLTAQQLRRSVYYGPYMDLFDEIRETCADFHAVRDPRAFKAGTYAPCKKDSDGELILRAFAFRRNGNRFKTPIKKFLNRELDGSTDANCTTEDDKRRVTDMVAQQRNEFVSIMKINRQIFGDNAFRKGKEKEDDDIEVKKTKRNRGKKKTSDYAISATMWDAKYCAIAELMAHHPRYKELDFVKSKDRIAAALQETIRNGFFATDDNKTTTNKFELRKHELKTLIQKAIETNGHRGERSHHGGAATTIALDQRRSFPPEWRQRLYAEQNGQCGLCGQSMDESRLDETDYVHMDHKQPFSKGGQTVYANAQLVHSICNRSKSNKDVHG